MENFVEKYKGWLYIFKITQYYFKITNDYSEIYSIIVFETKKEKNEYLKKLKDEGYKNYFIYKQGIVTKKIKFENIDYITSNQHVASLMVYNGKKQLKNMYVVCLK